MSDLKQSHITESEVKFIISTEGQWSEIKVRRSLGRLLLGKGETEQAKDTYYDSQQFDLLQAGYALRLRTRTESYTLALKQVTSSGVRFHQREEIQQQLDTIPPLDGGLSAGQLPLGHIQELVRQCHGGHLSELFTIDQTRSHHPILFGDSLVGRASFDCVQYQNQQISYEIEAEFIDEIADEQMEQWSCEIEDSLGCPPVSITKFERGLGWIEGWQAPVSTQVQECDIELLHQIALRTDLTASQVSRMFILGLLGISPETCSYITQIPSNEILHWWRIWTNLGTDILSRAMPKPTIDLQLTRNDSMAQAGRKVLRYYFQRMLTHELGTVLGQDIEELHDMRVSTRRMRSAIPLFQDSWSKSDVVRLRKGLKNIARALGDVRDIDVIRERVQKFADESTDTTQNMEQLLLYWDNLRTEARARIFRFYSSQAYSRFIQWMSEWLSSEPDDEVPWVTRPLVHQALADLLTSQVHDLIELSHKISLDSIEDLHVLRIEIKRLRYTISFFSSMLGSEVKSIIHSTTALQDYLGDLHDAHVATEIMDEILEMEDDSELRAGAAQFRTECIKTWQTMLNGFPEVWSRFDVTSVEEQVQSSLGSLAL